MSGLCLSHSKQARRGVRVPLLSSSVAPAALVEAALLPRLTSTTPPARSPRWRRAGCAACGRGGPRCSPLAAGSAGCGCWGSPTTPPGRASTAASPTCGRSRPRTTPRRRAACTSAAPPRTDEGRRGRPAPRPWVSEGEYQNTGYQAPTPGGGNTSLPYEFSLVFWYFGIGNRVVPLRSDSYMWGSTGWSQGGIPEYRIPGPNPWWGNSHVHFSTI